MKKYIRELRNERSTSYKKNPTDEKFLTRLNQCLVPLERSLYSETDIDYPFIFTIGPPRSGTTLITQIIAHCLKIGYINNLTARFWKAPVCGIRLSNILLGNHSYTGFKSNYGSTPHLLDVHEFGYFWRGWLEKDTFESIKNAKSLESTIDWKGLYQVLTNIQKQYDKPMVFKNILGSYHMPKFKELFNGEILFVHITRKRLDTAISILEARKKYYNDPNRWWSYIPPQYEKIINEDYWTQIAGQIHYLEKFYKDEFEKLENKNILTITYKKLCENPKSVLRKIQTKYQKITGEKLEIETSPPNSFDYRTYDDQPKIKQQFQERFEKLETDEV